MTKINDKKCKDCYWSECLHDRFTCFATKWSFKINENDEACERFKSFKYVKTYFADVIFNDYLTSDDVPLEEIEKEIMECKKLKEKYKDNLNDSFLKMSLEEQREYIFKSATKIIYTFSAKTIKQLSIKINEKLKKHKCILSIKIYEDTIKELEE